MTGRQFNTLVSIMFIGYVPMQIPSYGYRVFRTIFMLTNPSGTCFSIGLINRLHTSPCAYLCGGYFLSALVSFLSQYRISVSTRRSDRCCHEVGA